MYSNIIREDFLIYLLVATVFFVVHYFCLARWLRPRNIFDRFFVVSFVVSNLLAFITVLYAQNKLSSPLYIQILVLFFAYLSGVIISSRLKFSIQWTKKFDTNVYSHFSINIMLLCSIVLLLLTAFFFVEIWTEAVDPHINRISVYQRHSFFFYCSSAVKPILGLYILGYFFLYKEKTKQSNFVISITSVFYILSLGFMASRGAFLGLLLMAGLFRVRQEYSLADKIKLSFLLFMFVGYMVGITYIKKEYTDKVRQAKVHEVRQAKVHEAIISSIMNRLVGSADAAYYYHITNKEKIDIEYTSFVHYLLHPVFAFFKTPLIKCNLGVAFYGYASGDFSGVGPVPTFIYESLVLIGQPFMSVWAFIVGSFVGSYRNIAVKLLKTGPEKNLFALLFLSYFYSASLTQDSLGFVILTGFTILIGVFALVVFQVKLKLA